MDWSDRLNDRSRNPDVLYAATWDRHRTVAAYLGGGPGSGIHRSLDGGETWSQLSNGLPYPNKNFLWIKKMMKMKKLSTLILEKLD